MATSTTVSKQTTTLVPEFVTEAAATLTTGFRTIRKFAETGELIADASYRLVESTDELATQALAIKKAELLKQLESA